LLAEIPAIGNKGWVFTTNGEVPISGFSKFKTQFDAKVLEELRKQEAKPLPQWTTHDLRRTARSLMSRAGVTADHAERALGHVIGGVRGVYDRHAFKDEKRQAFETLAAQIERIVHPVENVVVLRA
jgi:integrase